MAGPLTTGTSTSDGLVDPPFPPREAAKKEVERKRKISFSAVLHAGPRPSRVRAALRAFRRCTPTRLDKKCFFFGRITLLVPHFSCACHIAHLSRFLMPVFLPLFLCLSGFKFLLHPPQRNTRKKKHPRDRARGASVSPADHSLSPDRIPKP